MKTSCSIYFFGHFFIFILIHFKRTFKLKDFLFKHFLFCKMNTLQANGVARPDGEARFAGPGAPEMQGIFFA
jgi:hypothetical protein